MWEDFINWYRKVFIYEIRHLEIFYNRSFELKQSELGVELHYQLTS